jgi:citrate/tricarballylate utilization protein
LPYGKFGQGIFRSASLLRYAVEKRQPSSLALGDE